jgi:hypothetical protein
MAMERLLRLSPAQLRYRRGAVFILLWVAASRQQVDFSLREIINMAVAALAAPAGPA